MSKRLLAPLVSIILVTVACGSDSSTRTLEGSASSIYPGDCATGNGEQVTIYSGRTENLIEPVLDAYACETGTDVEVRWGSSTELALLMAEEGDRTSADVFLSQSPGPVGFLEEKGLLGTVDPSVLDLVADRNRSSAGRWVGFSGRKRVLVYNLDEVTEDELPESVFELTDDKYRGQVAIAATNGSFIDWFTVFRSVHGTDVATTWLDDMVANDAKVYPNNRSIVEAAGRGEIAMGLVNHYYNYQEKVAQGDSHRAENHDFAADDIGSLLIVTAAMTTASTDNPDRANDLLAYLLSEPVQRYFSSETLEYPLAAGVEPDPSLPSLSALEIDSVDFEVLGAGLEETNAIIEASGILSS